MKNFIIKRSCLNIVAGGWKFSAILVLALFLAKSTLVVAATQTQTLVPAGSPKSEIIFFQYAIYYLPKANTDVLKKLKQTLATRKVSFQLIDQFPKKPTTLLLQARMENDVQKNYPPMDMESLQYFGYGLSREQAQLFQSSQQALILNFVYPNKYAFSALQKATELAERLARESNGLLWDEFTRQIFTADAWHEKRLTHWHEGLPDVSNHVAMHAYNQGEFVRIITLGMAKFGLPDVVVNDASWSMNRTVGIMINLFSQSMIEGASFEKAGQYDLDIKAIKHPEVRDPQLNSLKPNAEAQAKLTLRQGSAEKGDPENRIIELSFERYPGPDKQARLTALTDSLFGFEDAIARIKHNEELEAASQRAKAKLPQLRKIFNQGLQPGEFIQVKAPFDTPAGGVEWMWVEVLKWDGDNIGGMLKNEPFDIPTLHGGQMVSVKQQDIFDYMRHYPDGKQEGNETSKIIERMQHY